MIRALLLCLAGATLALPAAGQQAQGTGEALQLLQRVAAAAQKLSYTGVFVYRSGSRNETSRISHLIDGDSELERLEVLDGSPREVIRHNREVKCFLPEDHLLIVERRGTRQFFPLLLPGSLAGLTEYYLIRKGPPDRVAGVDSQSVFIEPKDDNRYAHRFWIDPQTGLLLKASLLDESGHPLEAFAFSEVKIGAPMDRELLKSPYEATSGDWRVQYVKSSDVKGDDGQWSFRAPLPGFRRISGMKRQLRPDAPESTQMIFSDGLASVSVFVEPLAGRGHEEPGAFAMGAVNVYKRQVADYQLIVMGDVPAAALRRFAEGMEPRKK
jgi:sigma-E factor negative regulatory protein RseB